jgi:hypothetical protein
LACLGSGCHKVIHERFDEPVLPLVDIESGPPSARVGS